MKQAKDQLPEEATYTYLATFLRSGGTFVDAAHTTIADLQGRPQYLVDQQAKPLAELIS